MFKNYFKGFQLFKVNVHDLLRISQDEDICLVLFPSKQIGCRTIRQLKVGISA